MDTIPLLQAQLRKAINMQDWDTVRELRDQLDNLRAEVRSKYGKARPQLQTSGTTSQVV